MTGPATPPVTREGVAQNPLGPLAHYEQGILDRIENFKDPRQEWRRLFSEVLGTFFLVLVAAGGGMMGHAFPGVISRTAAVIAPALMVMAVILFMGKISGAHLNPAMTLAFLMERKISPSHAAWYVVGQLLGAVGGAAVVLAWGPWGEPLRYGATTPAHGLDPWLAVTLEALCTLVLVGTVFVFLGRPRLRRFTPWTMSPMYAVMVSLEAPWTGTSTNPARTLGPALVTGTWHGFWVYLVGPALGAAAGVGLARALGRGERRVDQARIAAHPHDPLGR